MIDSLRRPSLQIAVVLYLIPLFVGCAPDNTQSLAELGIDPKDTSRVWIENNKVTGLTLSYVDSLESALNSLKKFPQLKSLNLEYTTIRDDQLSLLRPLENLSLIHI